MKPLYSGVAWLGLIMMNEGERYKEVEKRERLVQTFLIISGFLVAYTREDAQPFIVLIFSTYLIFTILYYIFVSRTMNSLVVNWLAFMSSYVYSLLILAFLESQLTGGFSSWAFYLLFIALTAIFTFSLLSPESSEGIVNWFDNFSKKQEKKHPKLLKAILVGISIILVVLLAALYLYL